MKSLFSRFKPSNGVNGGPAAQPGARPSQDDKEGAGAGRSDATIRVNRQRSLRTRAPLLGSQRSTRTPTPTSASSTGNAPPHPSSSSSALASTSAAPVPPPKDAAVSDDRPPSLVLPDIGKGTLGDWVTKSPRHRMSADNVKKVMFQSPTRNLGPIDHASESDLRARANGASGPANRTSQYGTSPTRRVPSPVRGVSSLRRASTRSISPTKQLPLPTAPRAPTPTNAQRAMSRSSSRASQTQTHARKTSGSLTSGSGVSHSPTKSTLSTLASSDASTMSAQSYLPQPESWSAAMDDELIANLGPRERARQEVLWEIVNSEERYVQDLLKLNDTFCKALLPASETSPSLSLPDPVALTRTLSPPTSSSAHGHGHDDGGFLPIAAHYASGSPRQSSDSRRDTITPTIMSSPPLGSPDPNDSHLQARTPSAEMAARISAYNALTRGSAPPGTQPSKSAPPVTDRNVTPTAAPAAKPHIFHNRSESGHTRVTSRGSISSVIAGPVTLPDDLEQVLTVISTGILEGHIKQVTALRKRYDEQFPLVRSLADVFTSHSDILREYATYILHLERALTQLDEAMATAESIATGGRRSSRRLEETQLGRLSKLIQSLEELAAERGEAGLSISLSKPFQRLLKYPLLFQNLLYNTSPSTKEYEATLAMVDEVQQIVRSIEDEKTSFEEREKTRDAWARIEGMEKNKTLMAPKPDRLLVSERSMAEIKGLVTDKPTKESKSRHRLSDILKGHKSSEQWIVRFTDVSLLCEMVGSTSLPMSTSTGKGTGPRSESHTDLSTKRMSASRRHMSIKKRNLYRFVKVYEWHSARPAATAPRPYITQRFSLGRGPLENVAEGRASSVSPRIPQARTVPLKTEDGSPNKLTPRRSGPGGSRAEFDDSMSDGMSVMSFAFSGEAKPKPSGARASAAPAATRATARPASMSRLNNLDRASSGNMSMPTAAANAKFANRLRSSDEINPALRPGSRVRRSLPPAMAMSPTDRSLGERSYSTLRSRVTSGSPTKLAVKPPWNSSTKIAPTARTPRSSTAATVPVRPASVTSRPLRSKPNTENTAGVNPSESAGTISKRSASNPSTTASDKSPAAAPNGKASAQRTPTQANASLPGANGDIGLGLWDGPTPTPSTATRLANAPPTPTPVTAGAPASRGRRNLGGHI